MRMTNGQATPEQCLDAYHEHYEYTGDGPSDVHKRLKDFNSLIRKYGTTFRPAAHPNPWARPFRRGDYDALVSELVPQDEYRWKRRERLDHRRLADFVSVKVQDAFYEKDDDAWLGRASRNATLANFRVLKAKGLVDWICNSYQYTALLRIATKYGLLHVYEDFVAPTVGAEEWRITRGKGRPRLIGPGPALRVEYEDFQRLYEAWKGRQQVAQRDVA